MNASRVTFLLSLLCGCVAWCQDAIPRQGLRLHLDAGRGVQVTDGRVTSWTDTRSGDHRAIVTDEYDAPNWISHCKALGDRPALGFHDRQVLKISGQVLPESAQCMTVVAVAKTQGPTGVGTFCVRQGSVPLIQLDTDSHGLARFIIRDKKNRTLQSVGERTTGRWGVYTGVLKQTDDGSSQIEVFFGDQAGSAGEGTLETPFAGNVAWVGGLPFDKRLLSWNGEIAEILVYNRALSDSERETLGKALCEKYGLSYKQDPATLAAAVYPWKTEPKPIDHERETDVCIVGAGSAGIGAALAAARRGANVVLVERQSQLGGTGVNAMVSAWEPGPGCSIAREIYDRMSRLPSAIGVAQQYPNATNAFPMGQWYVTPGLSYESTLRRAGVPRDQMRAVPYDPPAMDRVIREMLAETGRVTVLDNTTFFYAETSAAKTKVDAILVETANREVNRIRAKVFIDSTGCIHLARAIGCETMLGIDPRELFDEAAAPERGSLRLNAISRCYRIRPSASPKREPAPEPPVPYFPKVAHVTGWKDGPRIINPLPMLPGRALIDQGYERCMEITDDAVRAHWHWLQATPDFAGYEFDSTAPMLGIRESYRLMARYVLNGRDLEEGLSRQTHEDIIAVADHPCDIHGAGGHLTAVREAYGVPYRCLIPAGDWDNLLVACRGSGFSKIAASSCRLERTMIQLGHAAGAAAAMAVSEDCPVDEIDVSQLVDELDAKGRCAK